MGEKEQPGRGRPTWVRWLNIAAAVFFAVRSVEHIAQGEHVRAGVYAVGAVIWVLLSFARLDNPLHLRLSNALIALLTGVALVVLVTQAVQGVDHPGRQVGLIILLLPFFVAGTWVALRGPAAVPPHQRDGTSRD